MQPRRTSGGVGGGSHSFLVFLVRYVWAAPISSGMGTETVSFSDVHRCLAPPGTLHQLHRRLAHRRSRTNTPTTYR